MSSFNGDGEVPRINGGGNCPSLSGDQEASSQPTVLHGGLYLTIT
jgi:hypothetical protein